MLVTGQPCIPRARPSELHVQETQRKYGTQDHLLLDRDFESPDHGHGETKYYEVDNQIADPVPSKEGDEIHTAPRDRFVPVFSQRMTPCKRENGACNPITHDKKPSCKQC